MGCQCVLLKRVSGLIKTTHAMGKDHTQQSIRGLASIESANKIKRRESWLPKVERDFANRARAF